MSLQQQIKDIIHTNMFDQNTAADFLYRLNQNDKLTRNEGAREHFCVYFLPYNSDAKQVFLVHHKKSGLWLFPGGHIDPGETVFETLNREIEEEVGIQKVFSKPPQPFFISTVEIHRIQQPECRKHYDLWFLLNTNNEKFVVDPREFHDTQWCSIDKAMNAITDPSNIHALEIVAATTLN